MFTIRFQVYRVNQQMSRKEIRQPWKLFVLILMDTVVFLVRKAVVMISNNYTFIEIKALTTYTVRQFNNRKTKKNCRIKMERNGLRCMHFKVILLSISLLSLAFCCCALILGLKHQANVSLSFRLFIKNVYSLQWQENYIKWTVHKNMVIKSNWCPE